MPPVKLLLLIVVAAPASWMVIGNSANGQSFNCRNARSPDEILVCRDAELGRLDERMADLYFEVRNKMEDLGRQKFEKSQVAWIKERQACGRDRGCIDRSYRDRIARLRQLSEPAITTEERAEQGRQRGAATERAERERQQRAAEAKTAEEELRRQAIADRLVALEKKLSDRGFTLEKPIDFELDWRDLASSSRKVALEGRYVEQDRVEGLVVENPDLPLIRLYTDSAPRDARKMFLECRINGSPCDIIVGAIVVSCVANKDKLNEKEVPCLRVEKAFADPKKIDY